MTPDRFWGLGLLILVAIAGIALRLAGSRYSVDHLLEPDEATTASPKRELSLSPLQLCIAGLASVLAAVAIGLYIFYPPVDALIKDMNMIRVSVYDGVREEDSIETSRRIAQWRSCLQKLPTSAQIRFDSVDAAKRESVNEVLYSLRTLEEYVQRGRFREAGALTAYVEKEYGTCRNAFRAQK